MTPSPKVAIKQDLYLNCAPQSTLLAPDTIHNFGNIRKALMELGSEFWSILRREKRSFLKVRWKAVDDSKEVANGELHICIFLLISSVKVKVSEERGSLHHSTEFQQVQKVEVLQPREAILLVLWSIEVKAKFG
jgi:hypothetical protein